MITVRQGRAPTRDAVLLSVWTGLLSLAITVNSFAYVTLQNHDGTSFADFSGALRMNGVYFREPRANPGDQHHGMNTTVLRFLSNGTIAECFDYELNLYGVFGGGMPDDEDALTNAAFTQSTYRNHWFSASYYQQSIFGGYGIDRAFVRLNGERANMAVGRMPINYSIAGIFAVNDFFAPFSASSINTVYKPGVDSAKLSIQTGNLSNIELVGALGNDIDSNTERGNIQLRQSAAILYAHTMAGPLDLSIIGGRLAGKWVVGGSIQGDIGPVTLYSEGHGGFLDSSNATLENDTADLNDDHYIQLTAGTRFMLNFRNAVITTEYAYLSNGTTPTHYIELFHTRRYPDEAAYPGRHYAAISYTMELHPLLYMNLLSLHNLTDWSGMGSISFVLNVGDNCEWLLGALIPYGKRIQTEDNDVTMRSEYGIAPFTAFTELRYYF